MLGSRVGVDGSGGFVGAGGGEGVGCGWRCGEGGGGATFLHHDAVDTHADTSPVDALPSIIDVNAVQ